MRRLFPLVVLLAGCSRGNFSSAPKSGGDTLVYALPAKNTTLDPGKINDSYVAEALQNVVEGLVAYDETNKIIPWLAESYELVDSGRTYVFHLRKDVKFSNGRPLVADDFRWSWERDLAPSFASPSVGNYLHDIDGAQDYMDGKAKSIRGVKVIDDQTLRVTLDKPRPYFLGNLTTPTSAVFAKEAAGDKEATTVKGVVGTGPFKLVKLIPDTELDLDANDIYWGGKPKIAHIRRPITLDSGVRLSRFLSGDFDYLELTRQDAQTLAKDKAEAGHLRFDPRAQINYLILGEKAYAPFHDARVRQAVAMSIDRKHIVTDLLAGYAEAKGLVPQGVPGYQKDYAGLAFNPEAARKLLASAGFPGGKGLPVLEFDYTMITPEYRVIAEAVASDLARNLGVNAKPRLLEWGAYLDLQDHGKVPLGVVGWVADYLDPQNFISMQVASFGPQDKEGFKDAQVDALCAQADSEQNPALRMALYVKAERRAIEQAARIPIFMMNQPIMTSARLRGMRTNAIGLMPVSKVELTGR